MDHALFPACPAADAARAKLPEGIRLRPHIDARLAEKSGPLLILAASDHPLLPLLLQAAFFRPITVLTRHEDYYLPAAGLLRTKPPVELLAEEDDLSAQLAGLKDSRSAIVLLPEVRRDPSGCTQAMRADVLAAAARAGMPIVTAALRGHFLIQPLWQEKPARGCVDIDIRLLTAACNAKNIATALNQHEALWNERRRQQVRGLSCTGAEKILYACPVCRNFGTLKGEGEVIRCGSCTYSARLAADGTFVSPDGEQQVADAHLSQWLLRQQDLLRRKLEYREPQAFAHWKAQLQQKKDGSWQKLGQVEAALALRGLRVTGGKQEIFFENEAICDLRLLPDLAEFSHKGERYRLRVTGGDSLYLLRDTLSWLNGSLKKLEV